MANLTHSVLEICAGAGGQAVGLEAAGFVHELAVEIDPDAAQTLRENRPVWKVHTGDVREISGEDYAGVSLLAGGVPCPPFSAAGKQLGSDDERDLFPEALRLVREAQPRAVMLENVRGLASEKFGSYRREILDELEDLGYQHDWQLLYSSAYGVPQLRPRFILVAMKPEHFEKFHWPEPVGTPPTIGDKLWPLMAADGWSGAKRWAERAQEIGPTLVGGSRKHGGPDLGPTRAREAWLKLGVDGRGLANAAPGPDLPADHIPRLTVEMAAIVQGFPADWKFFGGKTSRYRQIGNAFPPPVAEHVGTAIMNALSGVASKDHEPAAPQLSLLRDVS